MTTLAHLEAIQRMLDRDRLDIYERCADEPTERPEDNMKVTDEMIFAAAKQAVKDGLLPSGEVSTDRYLWSWMCIENLLKAALEVDQSSE